MLRRSLVLALALSSLTSSCLSSGKKSTVDDGPQHYVQRVPTDLEKQSGLVLTEIDGALRLWSNLTATGDGEKDRHRALALGQDLRFKARRYYDLLKNELETGPTRNRMVSAMALGFSDRSEALPALLAALDDPDERVEINALIGLSVLASPDTEMSALCFRMTEHTNTQARAMAASAVAYCLRAGADGEDVLPSARLGLIDEEPVVRMHSALILAELHDAESIERLSVLLYDEVPIVQRAARQSLTHIGMNEDHSRGEVARALTTALAKAETRDQEKNLILYLQKLSSLNHGDKPEDWIRWANQIP